MSTIKRYIWKGHDKHSSVLNLTPRAVFVYHFPAHRAQTQRGKPQTTLKIPGITGIKHDDANANPAHVNV